MEENKKELVALGRFILLEPIETVPEKVGSYYAPPPSSPKIKSGVIKSIGNPSKTLSIGDIVFYDVSNQRSIKSEGQEFVVVEVDDILAKTWQQ